LTGEVPRAYSAPVTLAAHRDGPLVRWAPAAVLVGLVVAAYLPAMRGGFVWDDDFFVTRNMALRTVGGLRTIWLRPSEIGQYYPLVHTSFWVEYHLWALDPFGYHVVNVLLHAANAVLWWRVLLVLGLPGAWFAAALFALHPVQVESVAWITERKNVLSGLFYLSAALAYLRWGTTEEGGDGRRARGALWALALVLFVAALLAKSVTCSLPAALLLAIWWRSGRVVWRDVRPLVPMFVVGLALGFLTVWMETTYVGAKGEEWRLSFVERCLVAGRALWFYAGKLLWPAPLAFVYPRWQIDANLAWQYAFPAAAAAVVLALWALRHRIGRGPLVGVLYFAGTLFPALGFFDLFPMRYSFVADHFQYLASMGLLALAAAGAVRLASVRAPLRRRVGQALAAVLLLALAGLTWRQAHIYRDLETLWRDTLTKNPASWMVRHNLALELDQQGRADEALAHYEEAARLNPTFIDTRINLGRLLILRGALREAMTHYEAVLRREPGNYGGHRAMELSYVAHYNMGWALVKQGRIEEGIVHYRAALDTHPDAADLHYNLGMALAALGRGAEASAELRESLRRAPDTPTVLGELAWLLATNGDPAVRDGAQAVELAERASRLGNVPPGWILDILAAAYAEIGRFDLAVPTAQRARDLALARGQSRLAAVVEQRLALYSAGQPFHAGQSRANQAP
jgi:tetratricopeptide (TPR) repeat protein